MVRTIGILGAGKVGIVLAQLALKAGYKVYIAGSSEPAKIALTVSVLAPGAKAATKEETVRMADLVIAAIPLSKINTLPFQELQGKLVIDAMNHWPEVDGPREDTIPINLSSSEHLQLLAPESCVVKALSHMGYHELYDFSNQAPTGDRKAIAFAGDDPDAKQAVRGFIATIGFDPLDIGKLKNGSILEPGNPAFGASLTRAELERLLSEPTR